MPIFWEVEASVFCDELGCKARLTIVGDTPREVVSRIKLAGWLYRKNMDDGHNMTYCPEHAHVTSDMEAENGYDIP